MHVAFISRELPPSKRCGGIGAYVWDISQHLALRGHRVTIISAMDDTRRYLRETRNRVEIIRLPGGDFAIPGEEPFGKSRLFRHLRALYRYKSYRALIGEVLHEIVERESVDIVEFAEYGNEAAEWIERSHCVPMVVRCHGPASRRGGRRISWRPWHHVKYQRAMREYDSMRVADGISSPSLATATQIKADGRLFERRIDIIPNCVDFHDWAQAAAPTGGEGEEHGKPLVFMAGTIVEPKGVGDLISAVERLRSNGRNVTVTLAGKWGRLGHVLHARLRNDCSLAGWLHLLGAVPRMQLATFYRRSAICCFPSWWENCPYTCIEAMASGGLVIGSSAGGMAEIIRDGVDGFLVPPRDPQRLAKTIARVLDLPPERRLRIRQEAQNRIRQEFDAAVIVPRMVRFYEQVIERWKASRDPKPR